MSYLGRGLEQVDNISKLDNITFDGSTTYALTKDSSAFTPISSNAILISVSGVIQQGNFSISGTNIVFDSAVASTESCDFIMHYGTGVLTTPSDGSVTNAKISDMAASKLTGTVAQANIADQAINEAKLQISNAPTNGYMLTAQSGNTGGLTWAEAPSGEYVKIANVNTSSGTSMSFNDCFSTTYRTYLITFQFENDRNGNQLWFRFQKDDDTTFNSNYRYASHQINNGGTESSITSTGNTQWRMTGGTAGGNTAVFGGCFGYMYVHNPYTIATGQEGAGNIYRTGWNAHYCEYDDTGNVSNIVTTGMLEQDSENVAGVRFLPSANYLGKRNATVWGLKEY